MVVHDYVELSALTVKLHQEWVILYLYQYMKCHANQKKQKLGRKQGIFFLGRSLRSAKFFWN